MFPSCFFLWYVILLLGHVKILFIWNFKIGLKCINLKRQTRNKRYIYLLYRQKAFFFNIIIFITTLHLSRMILFGSLFHFGAFSCTRYTFHATIFCANFFFGCSVSPLFYGFSCRNGSNVMMIHLPNPANSKRQKIT